MARQAGVIHGKGYHERGFPLRQAVEAYLLSCRVERLSPATEEGYEEAEKLPVVL
jgi:hypothetical protein